MLNGKNILLGVTGGIAAYKAADICSRLVKLHANVDVIMTEHALNFITPNTFEALCHNKVTTDTFDRNHPFEVEHIALADKADCVIIAPATANIIGKLANGLADDMLSTTLLACRCPKLIAPAMNTHMWQNPIVQDNISKLKHYGFSIIEPASGHLACGYDGSGKLADTGLIADYVVNACAHEKDMAGLKVLVSAGPTCEDLDPVRFITNRSSGKMGYSIASAAASRGAAVTLVSGPVDLPVPAGVNIVHIRNAEDMYREITSRQEESDIIIKAAAVADYRPSIVSDNKIKKKDDGSDLSLPLERTKDILKFLGEHKRDGQFLCGFSMETENMLENSRKKLTKKNLDLIAANNVKVSGAGFLGDTNVLTLISKDRETELPLMSKWDAAHQLLDEILKIRNN
ncbi:bifunctional phosphopantothenoylcysteine decarboxylase/phosphopantothenate--cysteine ligase CoaBC [Oribacterium sp. P6A1]|uniref:bifunctional phosphopantothenoylcysteine decarboxylase/phosphopantothenate--cysteine ligase CoaBC n=1 Tax=Oribacterium sp. P6A1 TaxID=1410612 RepID=UPI000560B643|nr:bifunctional phosphopantothenoylcysteine decarboxylase/phosphopantothenate--cysteine ligase CoaBC [Oribacterium sp. P6A1]